MYKWHFQYMIIILNFQFSHLFLQILQTLLVLGHRKFSHSPQIENRWTFKLLKICLKWPVSLVLQYIYIKSLGIYTVNKLVYLLTVVQYWQDNRLTMMIINHIVIMIMMCIRMIKLVLSYCGVITTTGQTNFDGAGEIIFKSSTRRDIYRSHFKRRNFRTSDTITGDKALPAIHIGRLLWWHSGTR